MKNKSIAIITARGGSKRIPNKNIRDFCGFPIIKYSIDAALSSEIFDDVMVSTDSLEIAEIAKRYGAKVPFLRSAENSNDFSPTLSVINEVLNEYKQRGQEFDVYCCLYPTAVFINDKLLRTAYEKLIQTKADFLVPVYLADKTIQRAYRKCDDNFIERKWPEYSIIRTQDLEELYMDSGQFYFGFTKPLLNKKLLTRTYVELDPSRVHDIDTEEDWLIAEKKYKSVTSKKVTFENLINTNYQMDLLVWRNQEFVREAMINTKIITAKEHKKYINLIETSDKHEVFVALEDGQPFGVINLVFDHYKKTVETGSYIINKEHIGTGRGLIMAYARLNYIFNKPGYVAVAKIKKSNKKSIRLQEYMGFRNINGQENDEANETLQEYTLTKTDWDKNKSAIREKINEKFRFYSIGAIPSNNVVLPSE